jgi:integrase
MKLSFLDIKNARPEAKSYRISDGDGLSLQVQPNGHKFWRYRYRFAGVEKLLALGSFPATPLADARVKRDAAKALLEKGVDPSVQKKLDKITAATQARNTFLAVAEEFLQNLRARGNAETTIAKNKWLLMDLAAPIASRPIAEITPAELLHLLKMVEKSGRRETARRLRGIMGSVFRYAIVTLRANSDPTYALQGALLPPNTKSRAAITDENRLGALLRSIDAFDGYPTIRAALQFLALTFVRPGEVRGATREEFNFEKSVWRISAERTKTRKPHDIPLSRQALAVVRDIWPLSEGFTLAFPSIISKRTPLSENTFNSTLRRLGYGQDEVSAHGFRSSASTILNEHGFNPDVIEAALGHQDQNSIRRAYNRAVYWPERIVLMQKWADMLDEFRGCDDTKSASRNKK